MKSLAQKPLKSMSTTDTRVQGQSSEVKHWGEGGRSVFVCVGSRQVKVVTNQGGTWRGLVCLSDGCSCGVLICAREPAKWDRFRNIWHGSQPLGNRLGPGRRAAQPLGPGQLISTVVDADVFVFPAADVIALWRNRVATGGAGGSPPWRAGGQLSRSHRIKLLWC